MESAIDIVDEIITNGIQNYSFEHKSELSKKRPTPPLFLNVVDGKIIRKFQVSWYTKFIWLTGSQKRNKLFCYCCLLFRGEKVWCNDGIQNIKNFERKAKKHGISEKHLLCQEKMKLLGQNQINHVLSEGQRLATLKYNEEVGNNRRILSRLIQVVCYLGKQELPFRGHDES